MGSILLFAAATYGLTFLIADATIFGCSVTSWNEYLKSPSPEEKATLCKEGIFPLRPIFLRFKFFQKLLSCYFCLGVYTGVTMHWTLLGYAHVNPAWRGSYLLWGTFEPVSMLIGSIVAACAGGAFCFGIDRCIVYLEVRTTSALNLFGD